MIRPDGSVVILDLGIASALDTDTTRLTHTGSPIGSPAYMAPEQAMGGAVGPHTDLYALGVLLHELLSGEVPFAGSTALGVLHRHLHEEPVPVRPCAPTSPRPSKPSSSAFSARTPRPAPPTPRRSTRPWPPCSPQPPSAPRPPQSPPTPLAPMDPTRPFRRPHAPWPVRSSGSPAPTPTALSTPRVPEPLVPAGAGSAGAASLGAGSAGAAHPGAGPVAASANSASPARPFADPRTSHPAAWPSTPAPRTSSLSPSPSPSPSPSVSACPSASGPDVAAAVDEVKSLLDQGRITRAVDILGGILPAAAERHGADSPVVRTLRKQYAATLMDDGQYRRALPELRLLAEEFAEESGAGATRQALQFHYEAAQCLEQLGEVAQALEEYRALLPYFEHYADDPVRPLEIRRSIGHLLLAQGERPAAQESLSRLLYDAERLHGPHHPFPEELRRTLYWLSQVQG